MRPGETASLGRIFPRQFPPEITAFRTVGDRAAAHEFQSRQRRSQFVHFAKDGSISASTMLLEELANAAFHHIHAVAKTEC